MYHWARVAVQHDARSRAKYVALRGRGHSHGRALRSVADRLLNVACAMLKNRTLFNPSSIYRRPMKRRLSCVLSVDKSRNSEAKAKQYRCIQITGRELL